MRPVICMVTDAGGVPAQGAPSLEERVAAAARASVDLVQVRVRDLDDRSLFHLVSGCVRAVRGTRTRILVNDRPDIAVAAGAHGVHLRADSAPSPRVRQLIGPGRLLGRSVHPGDGILRCGADGAVDYLLFGTVFPSTSKPLAHPAGLESLRAFVETTTLPVLAIGGVTPERTADIATTGAAGFAGIGLFMGDLDTLPGVIASARRAFDGVAPRFLG